jgi:hypothetical protein
MSQNTLLYIAIGALVLSLGIVGITNSIHSSATDVSNDQPITFINIPAHSGAGVLTYNIVQLINGSSPRIIQAINSQTGAVDFQNVNASVLIQSVFNRINSNGGGVVHITGYGINHVYNITGSIALPVSGNLQVYGDGIGQTYLRIPVGRDNVDMFYLIGNQPVDVFFNYWHDLNLYGNDAGTNNTGFYLASTNHGYHDSIFYNIFIQHFGYDGIYIASANSWNMQFTNDIFEYTNRYMIEHAGGNDFRIDMSKFLFNNGQYALYLVGGYLTVSHCFFYNNQQNAILLASTTTVLNSNRFQDNGEKTNNGFSDVVLSGAKGNVVVGNSFAGSDITNKTKSGINISDNVSYNNTISDNTFTSNGLTSWGISPITSFHESGKNFIVNNPANNPIGKVTNFIDNGGKYFVAYGGTSSTIVNGTTYTISDSPVFITSTGGTGVNITLSDNKNNVLETSLTTLTDKYLPVGYNIKFVWATIPTAKVYFH